MSVQLDLRNWVRTQLLTAPAVAGGRVGVDPDDVLAEDDPVDVIVTLQASQGDRRFAGSMGPVQWITDVSVTCRGRAGAGIDATARADEVLSAAWARLAAAAAPAGVTDKAVEPAINFRSEAAEVGVCSIEFLVRFTHQTAPDALTARP